MDAGNYTDLAIGVAQSALGVFLAWRAFIVTLKVPLEQEHPKQKFVFAVCCIAVIALASVQTYRNFGLDRKLDKIEANTEKPQPAPIVNIPAPIINIPAPLTPKEHTHLEFMQPTELPGHFFPFKEGEVLGLNVGYRNAGDFEMKSSIVGVNIVIRDQPPSHAVIEKLLKAVTPTSKSGILLAHSQSYAYHSFGGPTVTHDDISPLTANVKQVDLFGVARWKDKTGEYETHLAAYALLEQDGTVNWHMFMENNEEIQIK